ncbi:hypothetical protein F5879DRAFT_781923, partial [Lentinula edodes]
MAALIIYIKFQTPVRQMRVILALLRCIVRALKKRSEAHPPSQIPSRIPKDIHTIVDCYDLDPTLHAFVACPNCYALSPLTDHELKIAESLYQANQPLPVCDEKSHPDSAPCGTTLWRTRRIDRRTFVTPIRKQVFQDLKEWIGRIVATPGTEDAIAQHQQSPSPADGDPERDFVDSKTFRQFKGSDGQPYAIPQTGPSGSPDLRLVTSLGFDAFNPFHSKTAHAINMFLLTVMTGKPSQHHINFTLRKLVKQLLPFWEGVFYVRTARYLLGRRVFIALIPAVCDTEGAHQLSGFASHSHTYFCRRCLLQIGDIHNLVPETWLMRDSAQHRELALKWKEASTEEERQKIYDEYGIRWSELLELPYWDPVLFTIIDDMHFAQLGLFETHLRDIWQIDHKSVGGDASSAPSVMRPAPIFAFTRDIAFENLKSKILDFSGKPPSLGKPKLQTLKALCQDLGIHYNSIDSKRILAARIMEYVCLSLSYRRTPLNINGTAPLKQSLPRHVIGKDLLEEIWADMKRTILPTWIQSPPPNWGTPAQGKLSADEYKVVCSISLVITLIRVWGYGTENLQSRRFQMLLNYLDLVHAIRVLLLRETSRKSRDYYRSHIQRYLETVLVLYPDFTLKPNHHFSLHVLTDLETMGPGHARSTPVFERINHSLQELNANQHLGEIEATMLTTYCRQANLQVILNHNADVRQDIDEAIEALKNIDREDHRGM